MGNYFLIPAGSIHILSAGKNHSKNHKKIVCGKRRDGVEEGNINNVEIWKFGKCLKMGDVWGWGGCYKFCWQSGFFIHLVGRGTFLAPSLPISSSKYMYVLSDSLIHPPFPSFIHSLLPFISVCPRPSPSHSNRDSVLLLIASPCC
jgi:hypothetical protein